MLTRLREIVEKVASAPRLNEALDILVTDVCQAMETEVCSVYLADNDRRCYYLMATRGLKKPRGRTVALAFDEGLVGLVGRLAEPINLADAQKHPSFKYIPAVKEDRFRAFLGVPIIQRRQLLGVLVVQQRELRQFDESEESFLVTLATQMAAILSQSQLNALFGQYRQTRIRALPASSGVAIAEGWMDVSLPLMEQVYEASTLDTASERERLTGALEEAANEFRRYSKRYAAGAQKETAAIFDLYSHLLSDARLRRELFAEVDKGAVAEWAVKKIIEKFAEQFAALSDGYLKSGPAICVPWASVCCSISTTVFRGPTPGRRALSSWRTSCRPPPSPKCRRIAWPAWWCAMAPPTPMPLLWCGPSASQR